MDHERWFYFYSLKFLLWLCWCGVAFSNSSEDCRKCMTGIDMLGYTCPRGDIAIELGSPLNITCVISKKMDNFTNPSSFMRFKRNGVEMGSEMIDIINSTAIRLYVDKPQLALHDNYICDFQNQIVCTNEVIVGTKPQQVTDFKCISNNYENLTCTWTPPENYAKTNYSVAYRVVSGERSHRDPMHCPKIEDGRYNTTQKECFWNVSSTPPYRPVHENLNFTITAENKFGRNETIYFFNHYANVKSGPPQSLSVINVTSSSIALSWNVPLAMHHFEPGVSHRILYLCDYGEKKWQLADVLPASNAPKMEYILRGLKHAYALYDIRVSLRSGKALPSDESMWSYNASITNRTGSKLPNPPETVVGSFETVASSHNIQLRDAYIYWKQIPEEEKNGANFSYVVKGVGGEEPDEITNTYAKFSNISVSANYTFYIWSKNNEGKSIRYSIIRIPNQMERIKAPVSFSKMELDSSGEFELNWEPPKLYPNQVLTNYTIFSCRNKKDRPYQCNGMLNWTVVPSDRRMERITVDKDKIFQFAVSANTEHSSSGMLWASCTIIQKNIVGKIKNVWINKVGSTFIEVGWKLDCSDQIGNVDGYIIYYCPIISPAQADCKTPQQNNSFYGIAATGGSITNLNPYTTYMLTVAVKTKHNTFSQQSDPLFNTTLESAPTVPNDLEIANVTNTTILVKWKPPSSMNGVLKYYEIEYSDGQRRHSEKLDRHTSFLLSNLSSYETYTISLMACTIRCSAKVTASVTTNMSYPGEIDKPTIDSSNDTSIKITWKRPAQRGGKNDYYDIKLKRKHKQNNETSIVKTFDHTYVFENCGDSGKYNTFYLSVRAVNIINGEKFEGPWSEELENYCYSSFNYMMYLLLILAVAILVFVGYGFTRLYHRCKIMQDVEVKLPPGLVTEQTSNYSALVVNPKEDSSYLALNPDSLKVPYKICDVTNESSCTMGLSLNEDAPYMALKPDSVKLPYKKCDISTDSSPYVMTGDAGEAVKSLNPGYIPFNQTEAEPIEKNSGYVVAGVKNINGYIPFNQSETTGRNTGYVVAGFKNCKLD